MQCRRRPAVQLQTLNSKHRSFSAELPSEARRSVTLNRAEANLRLRFGTTKLKTHDYEFADGIGLFSLNLLVI